MKKKELNITEGPLLGSMLRYAVPVILTSLLQLLYNSADMFVVGNFCDDPNAIGAIGCTGAMINLILGLFFGLGAGVCVVLARSIGSGDEAKIVRTVHTSITLSIIMGVVVGVIGYVLTPTVLGWMNTGDEFIVGATAYMRIYFLGSVGNLLYNFCVGMLRSRGDTMNPLIFAAIGGFVNIVLNLVFVIAFDMGVSGVAWATIISQYISAALSVIHMMRLKDACRLDLRRLGIDWRTTLDFMRIGIPAGLQGMMFSLSNVVLQSGYNSLSPVHVNANSAASQVDGYLYNILNAFYHTTLTFASQNYGARKPKRLKKVFITAVGCVTVIGITVGSLIYTFSDTLVGIFDSDPAVLAVAKYRLLLVALPYFLCGLMEVGSAMLRSIGYSFTSTVISFFGSCLFRIVWVLTVFNANKDVTVLYMVYPLSWTVTFTTLVIAYVILYRKKVRTLLGMPEEVASLDKENAPCYTE
ncbi:MAG: MATE family efflux transporter [Clostridia bacterium]|nr:MATE family efflux transporter [Clostridia bacterium]